MDSNLEKMAMVAKLHLIGILKRWQSKFLDCHPSESFPAPVSASPSSRSHVANSFFFSTLDLPGRDDNHGGGGDDNCCGDDNGENSSDWNQAC